MTTKISLPYITTNENIAKGKPIISGTRTRVKNIIVYYKLGYSPEELSNEFPHLSLSQIHDALSFYYNKMEDIDNEIEADREPNLTKRSLSSIN
jgi:uncharacterized protein (DUF433 family)